MAADDRQRLVVIGSGWVGLYIAQYIDTSTYAVIVVSPRRTSAYTPLLAQAACGLFPFSCAEESIRAKGRRIEFYKANASDIDFDNKLVKCDPAFDDGDTYKAKSFDLPYDKVVICPGCQTNTFGTPGVSEHAFFMKNVSDAMLLRKQLFDQLEKANLPSTSPEQAKALLHVAIVGGGPTGVEITAELSDLAKHELNVLYPQVAPLLRITIYDVAPHILGVYDKKLYEYATEHMSERGVNISTDSIIEKVDDANLHVKGKGVVPYGILLWVTGNKSIPFVDSLDVQKSEHGLVRIMTDHKLRVKRSETKEEEVYHDVFALGDAADIDGQSLPTTAEVAVQKARYLVNQLNSRGGFKADTPSEDFTYKNKGLVTYIGGRDGVAAGSPSDRGSGYKAWLSWRSGNFTWTRTWRNYVALLFATILNFLFGKDVARM